MKKSLVLMMILMLVFSSLFGCAKQLTTTEQTGATTENTEAPSSPAVESKEKVTITWLQFQIEVADQVKALAKAYEAEHPNVTIDIEVIGDGYFDILRSRIAANEVPDIFMSKGYNQLDLYGEYIEDLSDQPFVSSIMDAAKPCITKDSSVYGLPVQLSGWGIIYNKDIFAKYNLAIPTTKTELISVCETLQSNGITPFINQFKDTWLLGQYVGTGVGTIDDPQTFVADLLAGKTTLADSPAMQNNMDFLDIALQYGQANPLEGDWNTACTSMGLGEGAMMLEGVWVYDTIASIDPNINLGMFPVPYTDVAEDSTIYADVNGVWHVSSPSENKDVAKDILNWIVTSESGKKFINDCGFIPAYKDFASNTNPVGLDIVDYAAKGKTSIWGWLLYPSGFETESGAIYQEYIVNGYDHAKALDDLTAKWLELAK